MYNVSKEFYLNKSAYENDFWRIMSLQRTVAYLFIYSLFATTLICASH